MASETVRLCILFFVSLCCIRDLLILLVGFTVQSNFHYDLIDSFDGYKIFKTLYNLYVLVVWMQEYFLGIATVIKIVGAVATVFTVICLFETLISPNLSIISKWILLGQEVALFVLALLILVFDERDALEKILTQKLTSSMSNSIQNAFECCGVYQKDHLKNTKTCYHKRGCLKSTSDLIVHSKIALFCIQLLFVFICCAVFVQKKRAIKEPERHSPVKNLNLTERKLPVKYSPIQIQSSKPIHIGANFQMPSEYLVPNSLTWRDDDRENVVTAQAANDNFNFFRVRKRIPAYIYEKETTVA